jgi:hypothetical protein
MAARWIIVVAAILWVAAPFVLVGLGPEPHLWFGVIYIWACSLNFSLSILGRLDSESWILSYCGWISAITMVIVGGVLLWLAVTAWRRKSMPQAILLAALLLLADLQLLWLPSFGA